MTKKPRRCFWTKPPSMRWEGGVTVAMAVLLQLPNFMPWGRPGLGHLAWYLGLLYVYAPALVRSRRVFITVDARGCTEWIWPWGRRRTRWDEVTSVEVTDDSARIVTARGTVDIGPSVWYWVELAERAQAAAGQPGEPEVADESLRLPPEEVAAWLGIEVDQALDCRSDHYRRQMRLVRWLVLGVAGVITALMVDTLGLLPSYPLLLLPAALLVVLALVTPALMRWSKPAEQSEAVRATADALEVQTARGGWRRFAWGSLRHLSAYGRFQVVSTTEGDLMLPPRLTHAERLLHAIEQAIAARRSGLALPRMTGEGVPEGAISRASEVEVAVERGLSRADD